VSWADLYPKDRTGRAWVVAAGLTVAAVALMVTVPRTQHAGVDPQLAAEIAAVADQLPPDLQKRLDELLSAVKAGEPGAAEASEATLAELKELLSKLDPELQRKLADLAKQLREQKDFKNADEGDQRASDDPDSNAGMPEDMRWAAEDLAARLANADFDRQTAEKNPSATSETGEKGPGSAQAENTNAPANEKGMQMMRQAASDPGATQLMMAAVGAMGGDSSSGPGNNQGNNCAPGADPSQCAKEFASIAQALRKELIEASSDMLGENVKTEEFRRKTEQGTSSLGFTRIAPPATLERSRAASPPAVPDARRPLLFNYFIRPR
jgi:predicted transcriptional regulator